MSIITMSGPSITTLRREAVKTAKEIGYNKYVVEKLSNAKSQTEITNTLIDARHEWDVDPGRWFER